MTLGGLREKGVAVHSFGDVGLGLWRSPMNVRTRHAFMVEMRNGGLTLKEIQVVFHQRYGRTIDHSSIIHHVNGKCRCRLPGSTKDRPPAEKTATQVREILHIEIARLSVSGLGSTAIGELLGVCRDTVRFHRDSRCKCRRDTHER